MAFGIDDALAVLAGGIRITETLVETIERYKKNRKDYDIQQLLAEVRSTAIKRIDEADLALTRFERTLVERKINIDRPITDVINETSWWQPFEQHRLSQIQRQFNEFADSVYSAEGDIAALVRCGERMSEMGEAIVNSARVKHDMSAELLNAKSLKEAIHLLRRHLMRHRQALDGGGRVAAS